MSPGAKPTFLGSRKPILKVPRPPGAKILDDGKRPAARNVGVGLLLLGKKTPGGFGG